MKNLMLGICVLVGLLACNNETATTMQTNKDSNSTNTTVATERNRATALASLQAFSSHNVDGIMKDAAPDVVDDGDGTGLAIKSIDSVKSMIKTWFAAFPDYKGENMMALADGDHVAVFADWTGTFKGPFMGMKPTGKVLKVKDVDVFTFNKEGKIIEHRSVQSGAGIMAQVADK